VSESYMLTWGKKKGSWGGWSYKRSRSRKWKICNFAHFLQHLDRKSNLSIVKNWSGLNNYCGDTEFRDI